MTETKEQLLITEQDFDRLEMLLRATPPAPHRSGTPAGDGCALAEGLRNGRVIPSTRVARGVVTMNSKVRLRDLQSDEVFTFTLVYPADADVQAGKVSVLAPLGTALLGARAGHEVTWDSPSGTRRAKIIRVLYQPEAAGHFHL
jgi:regulator of nucleoside diphosphate kinase